jgi:hypothetical protein
VSDTTQRDPYPDVGVEIVLALMGSRPGRVPFQDLSTEAFGHLDAPTHAAAAALG